jgi:hypothetical protein
MGFQVRALVSGVLLFLAELQPQSDSKLHGHIASCIAGSSTCAEHAIERCVLAQVRWGVDSDRNASNAFDANIKRGLLMQGCMSLEDFCAGAAACMAHMAHTHAVISWLEAGQEVRQP